MTVSSSDYNDIKKLIETCPFLHRDKDGEIRFYGCCNIEN